MSALILPGLGAPIGRSKTPRTNLIRNNSMQGAVAGTPGTAPTNWVGLGNASGLAQTLSTGVENGVEFIGLRYQGTTNAQNTHLVQFDSATQVAALTGQTWTTSFFFSMPNGSLPAGATLHNVIRENTSGGVLVLQDAKVITPTANQTRNVYSVTLSGGGTVAAIVSALRLSFAVTAIGTAADFTIRIGWPQLERSPFATAPIRTTTAAQTRY